MNVILTLGSGGTGRRITPMFEASLIYKASSGPAGATTRGPVSNKQVMQTKYTRKNTITDTSEQSEEKKREKSETVLRAKRRGLQLSSPLSPT